ncbi:MAG: MBL fold metallo-hydrolase, partial [Dialister invisus]|nr:MBL fold metallo-hydrolase [Dialister invisus]
DLNWWHWAGEGDSDNLAARDEYFKELERIPKTSMDIVFFPVDARQAVAREWGVKAFLEKFDVSTVLVPMHAFGIRWSPSYEFRWRFPDIPLWIPKAEGDVYVGEVK